MVEEPIIRLDGVHKSYTDTTFNPPRPSGEDTSVEVLSGVDFSLRAGEKASLIGPSGSGKSTLLSLIAGLLRPDRGRVEIDGRSIDQLSDGERAKIRARRVGIALQADNLIPFMSAKENIVQALRFHPRDRRRRLDTRADELLERFGVAHRADHRPRHLSGGEAQRVGLAVALANRPAVLLADEVVAQLDGETAGLVVDEVLAGDFAVLYVTHDVELADRVDTRYELVDRRIRRR